MLQTAIRGLESLKLENIRNLVLSKGTSSDEIFNGCDLFDEGSYRGLVVQRSSQGEGIITVSRLVLRGKRAISVQGINLRRYNPESGTINSGSKEEIYFQRNKGYGDLSRQLRRLKK